LFSNNSTTQINPQVKDFEGFIFQYQRRKESEQVFIKTVCKNFIQHYKRRGLHQEWSIITIIGGSGTGKSRFHLKLGTFYLIS
jgi:hypothetical protein